jgi:AcrR family transcriptional regulator
MQQRQNKRTERTRAQIRSAAHRLFLRQGYLATSTDAILAEAGIGSKETLYRHYASKEQLFVDVLKHVTLEQPHFLAKLSQLPAPHDLPSFQQALTAVAREILSLMIQPDYLALLRITIAETPRFPQLGPLFRSAVPQRGIEMLTTLLRQAQQLNLMAEVDFDALSHALLGGLLTYALYDLAFAGSDAQPPALERADAIVALLMPALAR